MAKLPIIFLLFCSSILIGNGKGLLEDNKTLKIPTFRVYLQESFTGPNATLYEVARASITSTSPNMFGLTIVADDLMTAGPDPNSQNLGRAQGSVISTGLNEMADSMNFNFVFTAGRYQGSSLTVVGRKLAFGKNQEIPIVGGTGFFRLARGYTISNIYSYDPSTRTYVVMYDFYVVGLGI